MSSGCPATVAVTRPIAILCNGTALPTRRRQRTRGVNICGSPRRRSRERPTTGHAWGARLFRTRTPAHLFRHGLGAALVLRTGTRLTTSAFRAAKLLSPLLHPGPIERGSAAPANLHFDHRRPPVGYYRPQNTRSKTAEAAGGTANAALAGIVQRATAGTGSHLSRYRGTRTTSALTAAWSDPRVASSSQRFQPQSAPGPCRILKKLGTIIARLTCTGRKSNGSGEMLGEQPQRGTLADLEFTCLQTPKAGRGWSARSESPRSTRHRSFLAPSPIDSGARGGSATCPSAARSTRTVRPFPGLLYARGSACPSFQA